MALTTQKVEAQGIALKDIGHEIATQLAATGKWNIVVDNYSTGGFTIVETVQQYQFKSASAARIDNGVSWQSLGKLFRYEYPTAIGHEKLYVKIKPWYDSAGNQRGFSLAMSNTLNAGSTDFYDVKITADYNPKDYKQSSGTMGTTNPNTNNYMARALSTCELVSPANTNYSYFPIVDCYNGFVDKTVNKVSFWLQIVSDVRIDDAENGERCDMVYGVVKGIDANAKSNFFYFGVPKSLSRFVSEGWGTARAIVATTAQNSRQYSCVGLLGNYPSYLGFDTPYKGGTAPYEHNQNSIYPQYANGGYLAAGTIFSSSQNYELCTLIYSGYQGQAFNYNGIGHYGSQGGYFRQFNDYVEGTDPNGFLLVTDFEMYVYPMWGYYPYIGGSTTDSNSRYGYKPFLKVPTEGLFLWSSNQYMANWLGSNGETGDVMEYGGKRWLLLRGADEVVGAQTTSYQRSIFMFLENIV